ncbi:MAG TPA: PucR family transcriptional regulator ligand-binding domain-containing protein [Micromonosporaceae bacterium]|nr:PucR family transcriptional regulator ligand-binding domain-containing protein [Micromonosporaceae bacterium]
MRDVLGASSLAGAQVLAGATGLDRMVQRINVMEVPDILPWVKPHELLLTTGYPLRHDPGALVGLVADLDAHGLAALAIKLHRYLDAVPAEMLAEADRRGFPVIQFPDGVGFDDVLNEVLSDLLNRQAAVLARSEEVHRALVSVVLEGGDLADLAAELARILGGPVVITTPHGHVVARAGDGAELARLAGDGCFDPAGRFRVENEPHPPGSAGVHTVVPIVAGRVDHGRIVAFSRAALTEADVHSLERAATVAALAITKRLAVAAVESKYRADFLRDVLTGRAEDLAAAVTYARTLGWKLDRPLVVLVAELDPEVAPAPGPPLRPVRERFTAAWQTAVRSRDPAAAVASFADEVVTLLGAGRDGSVDRLVADLDRLVRADLGVGRRTFSLGVSRVVTAPAQLAAAYEQARKAIGIGRRLHGAGARASFERLGVHRLIALIEDTAELAGFVAEVLGELARDNPEQADLRHTLEVLLDTNCNVAEAARRLHFHYNTLRYRIGKLERIVGPFMDTAALRLDIGLALRVRELHGL